MMEEKDLTTLLVEKMQAEQDEFKDWLLKQTPEEVLLNAYQYTVKEDILYSFDVVELPDEQARVLLSSPSPLDDVYKEFLTRETGYMDILRDCVEERANIMLTREKDLRETPVYLQTATYASEHGELAEYRASYRANVECKEAIEYAVNNNYANNILNTSLAFAQVAEQFGEERMKFVLATTIREKEHDGRISLAHKVWAQSVPASEDKQRVYFVVDKCHPCLTDLFVTHARKAFDKEKEQPDKKPSVVAKLQKLVAENTELAKKIDKARTQAQER